MRKIKRKRKRKKFTGIAFSDALFVRDGRM